MPDYGHPLEFGTFITPINSQPEAPVALAELSESLGFDLVTFQDHPYQAAFLDTWTLLSWVAARTEHVRVSGNVLNLPLRQPAVLARSAASLDLLSGGRFELGLGAGGFWDAIVAMGGRRLTPGQGVDALSEAIDIIRGIWNTDERRPLVVEGEHYSVAGAKRGPTPAHRIPIVLGAYKPRMLRLVGAKADGWVPSLAYLEPGGIADGNRIIDEAATAAGRDPREIRRHLNLSGSFAERSTGLLNGPAEQWVEQLLPMAIDDGIGTFILGSDDPRAMQTFAEEVMPALRSAVAAERADRGTTSQQPRSRGAIALRRDGIDYDALPPQLAEIAIEPGDFGYRTASSNYMRGGAPGLVLRARNTAEVQAALAFAQLQDVPLGIRSAGHGISGRSTNDGGIIIDVGALDAIELLDESARRVRIEPGATWKRVAAALGTHGWALSSGDYGGVGVGGLATAGGVGWLARKHGLTIDHLVAADIVLADGTLARASADENPDLFWAIRGAGANFGIVTSFEFIVDPVGEVGFAQLAFDASDTAGFLERWGAAVEQSPREVTSSVILGPPRGGQSIAQVFVMVDEDDPDTIIELLQPFAEIAPLVQQSVQLSSYAGIMTMNVSDAPHSAQGEPHSRSALIDHVSADYAAAASTLLASGDVHFFQIRSVGGAVNDVDPDATAYANRTANFSVAALGSNPARLDAQWSTLAGFSRGMYLSFETGVGAEQVAAAFPPATLARLRSLKAQYDPKNVFRDNFNITPAG